MNQQEMNDYFLAGMIRALESIQEVRAEGDDLNTVEWQEVIDLRRCDMFDVSKLDEFAASAYSQKTLEENI
ncbi:MAG: hypothetical protein HOG69_00425 [Thaumarchaeota archaeon]|jgi:hypothetical protein|nr:hypothetical protein [Nitrososphaerota archaeon]